MAVAVWSVKFRYGTVRFGTAVRVRFGRFRFGGAWLGMSGRFGLGLVWFGMLRQSGERRSRLGLVVRGEEWQGGRGLERLVTVRLGEAVVARLGEMSCGLAR